MAERPAIILIVDDEPRNRKLLETILRREGYETISAANGEEALAAIAQHAPDLILLDIKLPGIDGYQVARALKSDPGTSNVPIIMVTVLVDRGARMAALNAGVEELVTKPIDPAELSLRVRNLLRMKAYGDLLENHSRVLEQKVQARTADLRASEQRLRTIIETDPECVKVVTEDMVLLDMNPAGLAMLEADSLAEAQAHPLIDFIVPEYRAAFADLHARVMRGESGMVEFQAIGLKGGRRWLETHAAPLGGGNGKAANLLGITRDITLRKKTDEQIKRGSETLRRFSAAMDATADAIYLVDRSTMNFVYVNEAACRMQGLTREELLALGPAGLLSVPRAELERIYDSVIAGGAETEPLEILRARKDGRQAWVELRRHAQRSGDAWTIVTLVRDITERKQAQQSVLLEKDFITAMLHSLPGLFYLIDGNGRFIRWNREFELVSGYSSEEIARLNPADLFAGADKDLVAGKIRQVFRTGEAVVEADYVAKHGTKTPYIFTGKRIQFAGNPHLIGMGIDLTERRLADKRIRRLNRVYAVLSGVNSAIVRIRERAGLFKEVCRIAVSEGGFILARVVEFDSKGQAGIAASTEVDTTLFQRIVDEYNADPEHSNSILALALGGREPIFSNDVATDPRIPNRAALTEKGTYALALLPLFVGTRLAATVILRAQDPGAFNADENRLLLELTANVSLALEHIEQEERLGILAAGQRRDKEELQRFRAAMDHSGDAIVLIDRASMRYIDVNQNLCDVTGRTRQELIGTTPMDLLGQSRETLEREYDALIARSGDVAEVTEGHYRRNDGSLMPIEKRRQAFRSEQGWIIVGTTRDITERKQAEQALRESERRFSDLLGNVQLVSVMLDREVRITYCNEFLLQLTGWRLEEVIGQSWVALFIPPESGDLKDRLAALLAGAPEARHGENKIVTRSGERRLIRWNNSVLRSAAGDVIGTASIGEDITEQKLAEVRIRRLNRVYAVLSGINTLIVRARDRGELFAESCRIAVEAGDFSKAWLGTLDPVTRQFRMAAAHGGAPSFFKTIETDLIGKIPSGKGLVARAMATLQPVVSNDTLSDPEVVLRDDPYSGSIRSIAVLPLVVEGHAVGVFTLVADTPEYFDDEEVKLLVELASDIAFAIRNIDRTEKLARLTRVNAMLSDINGAIVRIRDRQALFEEACRIAVETGGMPFAWMGMVDEKEMRLRPVASAGDGGDVLNLIQNRLWVHDGAPDGYGMGATAIRERRAIVVPDVGIGAAVMHKKAYADCGIKSAAALPLLVAGKAVGSLTLNARETDFFDGDEMALLNEMVANIAFALEHIEKEEKVRKLTRVYAVLSGINTLIVRARDRDELFREACQIAVEQGQFKMAWLGVVNRSAMTVEPVASAGSKLEYLAYIRDTFSLVESPADITMTARAVMEKKAHFSNDTQNDPGIKYKREHVETGTHSLASIPLLVAGEAVGVLCLYTEEADFFDAEELALLVELASNIAFAVDHIDKAGKIGRMSRVNALLSGINAAIVRIRDPQELFEESCRIAVETGSLLFAWIGVVDASETQLQLVASAGRDDGFLQTIRDRLALRGNTPDSESLSWRAVRQKRAVVVNDVSADTVLRSGKAFAHHGIRSVAVFPLMVAGRVAGALALHSEQAGFFDDDELRLLNEVAANISFALEHIEKAQKLARMTRINAILSGINGAIVQMRDRKQLFQEACRIAVETGGLPFCWLCIVDETGERLLPVGYAGPDDGFLEMIVDRLSLRDDAPNGHGISARSVREKRTIRVGDVAASTNIKHKKPYADRGIRSSAAFPLLIGGRVIGTFSLAAAEVDFFDDEETKLLEEVARNIAFALEHIEKEEKVERLTRVYAVSSGITSLIVHVDNREELFRETCRIAVEHGKFAMAWIGAYDPATQDVTPVAWAGEAAEELTRAKSSALADDPRGTGAVGQSIRARRPIFNNNILTQAFGGPRLKEIMRLGFQSHITLPLYEAEAVVATLTLYTKERGFFDADEVRLLTELAADISFALENISRQHKLDYLAYYDELTGLANRRLFLERLAQHMRAAISAGHKLALFFLDLERFRNITESLGRPAGDSILKQVGEWLVGNVGDANLLARLGADHFAVILPEVKEEGDVASLLDKRIRALLDHQFRVNDTEIRITTKVGVALFPNDGTDADTLLKNAEAALKKAKAGGDRYLFFKEKMTDRAGGKLTLENQLREALDKEEFVLHYQPKVNLESGKLTGGEALIRWNNPRTGLVPPGQFIPILEETGLIYDVGRWALGKAIEDYLRWRAAGLPAVRIAVNVSPLQLRNRGFVDEIKAKVGIHPAAAAGLELEITESLIMEDVKHNIGSLQAIRAMGVTIAIDDFGTGFSSLSYLSKLPVDTLKIDRSFIIDMTSDAPGLSLVSTIINLAHALNLKVVAEGVESEEQSRLLRLLRCDEMQGFLFSKPVPAEVFETKFLAPPILADAA